MRNRWDTKRTEAFSDGVLAIAVTLLVLDPAAPGGRGGRRLTRSPAVVYPRREVRCPRPSS